MSIVILLFSKTVTQNVTLFFFFFYKKNSSFDRRCKFFYSFFTVENGMDDLWINDFFLEKDSSSISFISWLKLLVHKSSCVLANEHVDNRCHSSTSHDNESTLKRHAVQALAFDSIRKSSANRRRVDVAVRLHRQWNDT